MNGAASFLHSKEGVTQGYTLAMIAYGIGILPLIKNLKQDIPDVTQPWHADNTRGLGMLAIIETYFNSLTRQGPGCGYYPRLSKSILIVHPDNFEDRREFGARHRFKVCTGARYFGGYIKDDDSKKRLAERVYTDVGENH